MTIFKPHNLKAALETSMNRRNFHEDAQSTTLGLSSAMAGIAPRTLPYFIFLLLLFTLWSDIKRQRTELKATFANHEIWFGILFCGYAALSALWSFDPYSSATSAAAMLCILLATFYISSSLSRAMADMSPNRRLRFLRAIPIGCSVAIFYLFAEALWDNRVAKYFVTKFPELAGDLGAGFIVQDGKVSNLNPFYDNRNVASIVMFAVPFFVSLWIWLKSPLQIWGTTLMSVALLIVVFSSENETAKLALLSAVLIWVLAYTQWRWTFIAFTVAFSAAVVFAVPLAKVPYGLFLHQHKSLPYSARDRVLIWDYTAHAVAKNPVFGIGARSTRHASKFKTQNSKITKPFTRRSAWHAHNMYLQTWYELGAIGAILLLGFGLAIIHRLRPMRASIQPWGLSLASVILVYAGVGWGFWQTWWQGALAFTVIGIVIIGKIEKEAPGF